MKIQAFSQILVEYKSLLMKLQEAEPLPSEKDILAILRLREKLNVFIKDKFEDTQDQIFHIIELDELLREQGPRIAQSIELADWRASFAVSESSWWWYLDNLPAKYKSKKEILIEVLTGLSWILSLLVAVEIIRRLWVYQPDFVSFWITFITLVLMISPLFRQSQEIIQGIFSHQKVKNQYTLSITRLRLSSFVLMASVAFLFWILPGPLANHYNNKGIQENSLGNIGSAQRFFERASAVNPNQVVPYHNLADAYANAGLLISAEEWYQRSIILDGNFTPAYRGLGEVYNQRGLYTDAEKVLLAGLQVHGSYDDTYIETLTQYELLANLGWSYWKQEKYAAAQDTMEAALFLEDELRKMGETRGDERRLPLPHFVLAQIYQEKGNISQAVLQWEDTLRFIDQNDWRQLERYRIAESQLEKLTNNN